MEDDMKTPMEYSYHTAEVTDDADWMIDFRAQFKIPEHDYYSFGGDREPYFLEMFRQLLMQVGHELLDIAYGNGEEVMKLWEKRIKHRLTDQRRPILGDVTGFEEKQDA
jgi:hypothetical protein